jgi:hypothetical protein
VSCCIYRGYVNCSECPTPDREQRKDDETKEENKHTKTKMKDVSK